MATNLSVNNRSPISRGVRATCDPTRESTIKFRASGKIYGGVFFGGGVIGSFTATGTVQIGPQNVTVVNRPPNSGVVLSFSETFQATLTTGKQFVGTDRLSPFTPSGILGGYTFAGYPGNLGQCNDNPAGPNSYGFTAVTQHDVTFSGGQQETGTSFAQTFPIYGATGQSVIDTGFREDFLADSTATNVICTPTTLAVAHSTTCKATVTDPAVNEQSMPTGTVSFTSSDPGTFSSAATCTLNQTGTGSPSCQVTYSPSATGSPVRSETITASYSGDTKHTSSTGATTVSVQPTTKQDCMDGRYLNYGFRSQGQCLQYVNHGG